MRASSQCSRQVADAPRLGRDGRHSHGHRAVQACGCARRDPLAAPRLANVSLDTVAKCFAKCGLGDVVAAEEEPYMLPPEERPYMLPPEGRALHAATRRRSIRRVAGWCVVGRVRWYGRGHQHHRHIRRADWLLRNKSQQQPYAQTHMPMLMERVSDVFMRNLKLPSITVPSGVAGRLVGGLARRTIDPLPVSLLAWVRWVQEGEDPFSYAGCSKAGQNYVCIIPTFDTHLIKHLNSQIFGIQMLILGFAFKCAENCIRICICDDCEGDLAARARGDQVKEDSSGDEEASRRQLRPLLSPRRWPWDTWENLSRLLCWQMIHQWWKLPQNCRPLCRSTALGWLQRLSRSPLGTSSLPSE